MYTEAWTVLRAIVGDFFFNCWCLEILSGNPIQHESRFFYSHGPVFKFDAFQISKFEVEAIYHS
jgi:hypothetical protein